MTEQNNSHIRCKNAITFMGCTPEVFEKLKQVFENTKEITMHAYGVPFDTAGVPFRTDLNVRTENDKIHLSVDVAEGRLVSSLIGEAYCLLRENGLEFDVISNFADKNITVAGTYKHLSDHWNKTIFAPQ